MGHAAVREVNSLSVICGKRAMSVITDRTCSVPNDDIKHVIYMSFTCVLHVIATFKKCAVVNRFYFI